MTLEVANDVMEALERAGGVGHIFETVSSRYVSISRIPDVRRFIRALDSLNVSGRIAYSAGTGWRFE